MSQERAVGAIGAQSMESKLKFSLRANMKTGNMDLRAILDTALTRSTFDSWFFHAFLFFFYKFQYLNIFQNQKYYFLKFSQNLIYLNLFLFNSYTYSLIIQKKRLLFTTSTTWKIPIFYVSVNLNFAM